MGWERGGGSVQCGRLASSRRVSRTCEPDHPLLLSALLSQDSTYSGLQSQTVTPLSPGRGGRARGAAGVRDVCGPESDMPCPPCVCFITSKEHLESKV